MSRVCRAVAGSSSGSNHYCITLHATSVRITHTYTLGVTTLCATISHTPLLTHCAAADLFTTTGTEHNTRVCVVCVACANANANANAPRNIPVHALTRSNCEHVTTKNVVDLVVVAAYTRCKSIAGRRSIC